ncbi:hypothetical protein C731_4679 [Mycolicibacterium hassiacum DSM 44199]|jgi:hypothetical protein|uniref:Uncharacterized protein n=1 Tax=Mycolicibacterium hassiacum (strain DSM 44199 / CIP 105218 / JCM 12690 / 3849) TaxID=1122247 RepID=K5BCA0_MYCHD|nr:MULTISPECIES: hypothetical protein [Mycolicibacterium]PZN14139.1 MAG: hypothetical protein DIU75_21895 [Mycolicibacterium hassiacum]EID16469.1 hypothetical protein MPHLEI_05697 [Mycolicibacterium phlei RIVM601174]EKF21347.1 hypothetical protein C731_4679 [Mycolicibacterium hassiacum DSM 44199]MBF4194481.1 hypothetical protein [Mycolicibacterium phlei]MDA4087753.1 hypothetical protein [Mycolicibacterium hassiacum DSM 44199]
MKFDDVIDLLDRSVGGADAYVGSHGAFWRGVTRERFLEMKVGGRKLVTPGDGANSNLVLSLRGQPPFGSDLDEPPAGALLPRMPAYLDPLSEDEIRLIEQWIDDGCP